MTGGGWTETYVVEDDYWDDILIGYTIMGNYYLYDVPTDILVLSPEYEGKIGYICEYEV